MRKPGVIDADGHVQEPYDMWPKYLESKYLLDAPRLVTDNRGIARRQVAGRVLPVIGEVVDKDWKRLPERAGGHDPHARLKDMDAEGMDIAVLFPTIGLLFGGVEKADVQAALCRANNNWIHDYTRAAPNRLFAVAAVPQLDIKEMLVEARRAVTSLGCKSVFLRPNAIGGRTLDDPYFDPLWSLLVELDVPLCVHEGTTLNVPTAGMDRYQNFLFRHVVSHPHEQQMACLEILCGGVLERHPALRVAFMEAGCGWAASWIERLDHHMKYWGHTSRKLPHLPSEYFLRQCFISADPDEQTIPGIVQVMGDANIVFASDYPHQDSILSGVVAEMTDRTDLSETTKAKILVENARRLFRIGNGSTKRHQAATKSGMKRPAKK